MDRGTTDGFVGSWASRFGHLVIDGIPVLCDNVPRVRALVGGAHYSLCQNPGDIQVIG